ncbi:MAG TPA: Nif3-like dinuclear metal center hexameric protein [Candidatus Brocadiia bacterium]|nr:Nif3-like dinuclear metal center hexameric protein [Candidatus Brocadiia bacterium]
MTTTTDIREYLLSNSPWVNRDKTVDTVKIGDPSKPIAKAGVCWYSAFKTIRAAHEAGCQLLICHEPTFWEHAAPEQHWRNEEPGLTKRKFLEQTGMVILRAHDSWDNWPDIGIRDSWAAGLGLTNRVREGTSLRWHAMYRVPNQTLRQFAQYVADRIAPLGEDSVQVIGDPDMIVSKPALGVGCAVPDKEMVDFGADVLIMCYDGASYWSTRERIAEMGVGVITVEHGTSEMWGMENLRKHLSEVFKDVEFRYFAEHPRTWTVKGSPR